MPAKAYPFPEWLPDQSGQGLSVAKNVFATATGYAPVKGPQAVTAALPGTFTGGGAFIASDGTTRLVAGTSAGLFIYDGGVWQSESGAAGSRWRLSQFGDYVMIANGAALLGFNIIDPTMSGAATGAPTNCKDVASVRDFVMVLTDDDQIVWSAFNNLNEWTPGVNQSDAQPSLWGRVRRLIGGEYGVLITDTAIVRLTYIGVEGGLDIIWQFDQISAEIGCMADGSVCNVGRLIFFLSERGFMMCDGSEVIPIADEKFNRWFFSRFSRDDIANIWSAIDPRNSLVLWGMPGTPGTIIAYNWVLKKATTFETDLTGLMSGYTLGTALDDLDAIYGDLDSIPVSLDSPAFQGGNPLLLIAGGDNALYALTGDNLQATVQLDNVEPTPGRRSRIRGARLVTDAVDASVTIDARMRAGDNESIRSASTMRSNGKLPIRSNGRYNNIAATIPAGATWSYLDGVELEFEPGDGR